MRTRCTLFLLVALAAAMPPALQSQQPDASLDSLRHAVGQLQARLDSIEAGQCPSASLRLGLPGPTGNAVTDSMSAALLRLSDRVNRLQQDRCAAAAPSLAADTSAGDDLAALRAAAAGAAEAAAVPAARTDTGRAGTQFVSRQRNLSVFNPEISATGDVRMVAHDRGVQRNNFDAREFEVAFQSALDPYSNTKIFLTFENDEVGVEEGYIYWSGLPGKLRLDVGKFRQEVGDLNRWHLHALPETEYPLVYRRFFGPEGSSGVGISVYSLLPVSLAGGAHELWLQGTTVESDPFLAGSSQPVVLARLQNFWQLTRSTYAQVGFTGTLGSNRDSSLTSNITGLDARLTWRPPEAGTRRDVTLRLEGYRLHANQAGTRTSRYGLFADVQAKVSPRWVLGARYDYVEAPRGPYADEWMLTPVITWWQSEFVYLRLQGQRHRMLDRASDNTLTLQVVWAMGPHKHETY